MAKPSLREYIETKLVTSGFAVDQAPEGKVVAWPRGMEQGEAAFTIDEREGKIAITAGDGRFASKKMQKVMDQYLTQWCVEYELGAR